MSYTVKQLLSLAGKFEEIAADSLTKTAEEKKNKSSKKKGKFPFWLKKKGPKASEKDTKPVSKSKEVKNDKKKKSAYYDAILAKFGQESYTLPTQEVAGPHSLTIDPSVQKLLGVVPDGKIGDRTQAALDKYKASKCPGKSNAEAIELIKADPSLKMQMVHAWEPKSPAVQLADPWATK
jgi:hypothetical protein